MNPLTELRKLVPPAELAQLERLELVAHRVVSGVLTGRHDSRMKGGCHEFAEHRAYSPGDAIRNLDWRVAAKCDRYYVKEFHEESALNALLVLDASGSMNYGDSTPTKFAHARAAAACLARLLLGQRDPVGLAIAQQESYSFIPPRSAPGHLFPVLKELTNAQPGGATALLEVLDQLSRAVRKRSHLILLTDAFVDVDALERSMLTLAARGHRLILFHVLAPEELSFSFRDGSRFQSLEVDGEFIDVDPALFADTYLQRIQAFIERLKQACVRAGGDYQPLPTHESLGTVLSNYLRRRARRS